MSVKRPNEETPFLQDFLEDEANNLENHRKHLPWSLGDLSSSTKKSAKETKAHLTDFVIGFFTGKKADHTQ